jgi:hypothetical protein
MTSNNKNQPYNYGAGDAKKRDPQNLYKQESSNHSRSGMQGPYDDYKGREYKSNPVKTFFSANQNKVMSQRREHEAS